MLQPRTIAGVFARLVAVYVLLMAPWPGLKEAYATLYRAAGSVIFSSFGSGGTVHFEPLDSPDPIKDSDMVLSNRPAGVQGRMSNSSRHIGYVPAVVLVALALATPTSWSRRWKGLAWGLLLIHAYITCRLALLLLNGFSEDNALALYDLSPAVKGTIRYIAKGVMPSGNYVVPIFVWIIVLFRREDWVSGKAVRQPRGQGKQTARRQRR